MQDSQLTVGSKSYDRFQETPDKTTYVSNSHNVGHVDILLLGRTIPTGIDGQAKSRANFVQDVVSNEGTADAVNIGRMYANVEFSVPAKATAAHQAALLADFRAYVASTSFESLLSKQSI